MEINKNNSDSVLIYDIECATKGAKPDIKTDVMKIFGAYSYKTNKFYVVPVTDKKFIKKLISAHKFLVGFNNEGYDNPILERHGFSLEYKRIIDLMQIFKKRASSMATNKGLLSNKLMSYSLDYITRFLDLVDEETAKDVLDYNIFKKEVWTKEEKEKIIKYTKRDLEITKKLYEWVEEFFEGFKEFVPESEVTGKYYLTDTVAKFSYKAICHALGWEPEYDSEALKNRDERFKIAAGGYCSYPAGEHFEGDIYLLDFNSLYPHIMMQCNLFSRNKLENKGWHGSGVWDVEGYYNDKDLHPISKLLETLYHLRLKYKLNIVMEDDKIIKIKDVLKNKEDYLGKKFKNVYHSKEGKMSLVLKEIDEDVINEFNTMLDKGIDRREYTIKILINSIYGISLNPYYKLVFDKISGGDCTRLGRQWTKHARKKFRDEGYNVLVTDTDSYFVLDHKNDKEYMLNINNEVVKDIKNSVPFPMATFDAGIDDEIKHIFFFKGKQDEDKESDSEMDEADIINKPKGFMKKNYIYVTKEDKVVIKNLGIKKKNVSAITKKIFWERIVPHLKEGKHKFYKSEIKNWMIEFLSKDITLSYMRKDVKDLKFYKKSMTSMPAQISKKYGPGIHFMIPNKRNIGVGKDITYCSVEEFEQYNMDVSDLDLTNFWKELNYFIKPKLTKTLFSYG